MIIIISVVFAALITLGVASIWIDAIMGLAFTALSFGAGLMMIVYVTADPTAESMRVMTTLLVLMSGCAAIVIWRVVRELWRMRGTK